jgi:hypothetical protein
VRFFGLAIEFDHYTRRARLTPVALAALPGALAALVWLPAGFTGQRALVGLLVGAGLMGLLAQVARDAGKRKEKALFLEWGGNPTVRFLRHRDSPNKVLAQRRHRVLEQRLGIKLPTAEEEARDRKKADDMYEMGVLHLREVTRDQTAFGLLFEENVNYGFRRNMFGLRSPALAIGLTSAITLGVKVWQQVPTVEPVVVACTAINVALTLFWSIAVNGPWVRLTADAYAERLLGACDILEEKPTT